MNPTLVGRDGADDLLRALRGADRIAVDTEFHAERRFVPELYLVQVAVPGAGVFVIDPRVDRLLERLAPALLRPAWIVHAGQHDLRLLHTALGGVADVVHDTQIAAGLVSTVYPAPYTALVSTWLGRRIDKSETMSDWSKRPLSPAQLRYAAEDVKLLEELWGVLSEALETQGRSALAAAAFAEERSRARDVPGDDDAWRQIGAGTALEGVELAVLQELAAWREEQARIGNQPPRTVLADGALVELARRRPITPESVLASRRLPKGLARSAEELAERIGRAQRRPSWGWPTRIRRGTGESNVSAMLQVFAAAFGQAERFAGSLALPPVLADRIALADLAERADLAEILGPWRDALAGDALWAALAGEIALHMDPGEVRALRWELRSPAPEKKG